MKYKNCKVKIIKSLGIFGKSKEEWVQIEILEGAEEGMYRPALKKELK